MKRTYGINFYQIRSVFGDHTITCELCLEGLTLGRFEGFRQVSKNCRTRCEYCDRLHAGEYDLPTDGWSSPLPDSAPGAYYVTAIDDAGRVAKVAGPFPRHALAVAAVEPTRAACTDPRAAWYAWGTCRTEGGK